MISPLRSTCGSLEAHWLSMHVANQKYVTQVLLTQLKIFRLNKIVSTSFMVATRNLRDEEKKSLSSENVNRAKSKQQRRQCQHIVFYE